MRRWVWIALWLVASCGDELAKPELIANLRVLALRSEPPMGAAGTDVTLDALVMTPDDGVAIERAWFACVASAGTSVEQCVLGAGNPQPCATDPEAKVCLLGGGESASYRLPQAALEGRAAGEDGQVFIGLLAGESARGGVAGCLAEFARSGAVPEPCRIATKRVVVRAAGSTETNRNPGIADLTVTGENLRLSLAADAQEATADGPEKLFFSWFVTAGELDAFRTDLDGGDAGLSNLWSPASQAGKVVVVVRDGRGGESWIVRER